MILLVLILLLVLASIVISYSDFACCPVFAVVEGSSSNPDQNSDTFNKDIRNDDNYNNHVFVFHTVPTKAISTDKAPLAATKTSSQDQKDFRFYPSLSVTSFLTGSDIGTRSSNSTTEAVAATMDSDSDGLTNIQEVDAYRTNMNKNDSDTDGLSDGKEVNGWVWFAEEQRGCINATLTSTCQIHNTNPLSPDTDGDRNSDYNEYIVMGSYPIDPDQDKDGIIDGLESGPNSVYHTSFFDADSDNDGLSDGIEIRTLGRDPTISDGPGSDSAGNDASPAERSRTNDPPIANALRVVTVKNDPVDIILTGSDSNSDTLHFFIATQPLHGFLSNPMVTGSASAELTYTPLPNYAGEDSFTFWAYDGKAYSSSPGRVFIHISS